MRISSLAGGAALALALAACGSEREAAAAIPRQKFVAANIALRAVPDSASDAAARREAALKKHRVTEKELQAFVAAHGGDLDYMSDVYQEIAREVDKIYDQRVRAASSRPSPPPAVDEDGQAIRPPGTGLPPAPGTVPPPPPRQLPLQKRPRPAGDTTRVPPPRIVPPDQARDVRPWQPPAGDTLVRPGTPPSP